MDMYPLAPCQCEDPQAQKQEHGCSWHRSKPKGSPEKMSPTPNKLKKNRDSPTCSTDNLLSLDSDHSDTSSTMYAASAASTSVEELAEVKPRIFLDVVDNAIDTEYPTPKPPSQDGSPDPYHDLKLGTEVLLERKPCNCRIHDLENRRLGCEAHERLRVQGTGALSSPGIKDADIPKETVPETVGMPDTGVDRETKSVEVQEADQAG
jgi:hypothetical protein